jgi:hypothetical protein
MQLFKKAPTFTSSLQVSDYFASIVGETVDFYTVELTFSLLQSAIIRKNLGKVNIKITNSNIKTNENYEKVYAPTEPEQTQEARKNNDIKYGQSEIKGLLTKSYSQRAQAIAKSQTVIDNIDIENLTLYVSPQIRNDLSAKSNNDPAIFENTFKNIPPEEIPSFYQAADIISPIAFISVQNPNVFEGNVLDRAAASALNKEILVKDGVDPSSEILENNPKLRISSLRKYYSDDSLIGYPREDTYYALKKKSVFSDRINITLTSNIQKKFSSLYFDVTFDVFQLNKNVVIDRKKTRIEFPKLINVYRRNFNAPAVRTNFSYNAPGGAFGTVSAKQADKSDGIEVYKKSLYSNGNFTNFSLIEEANVTPNNYINYNYNLPSNRIDIFRFVSFNSVEKTRSESYSSAVLGKTTIDTSALIIVDDPITKGTVKLTLLNPPPDAVQYKIVRKFQNQSVAIKAYTDVSTTQECYDTGLSEGKVYTYFVLYKMSNGQIFNSVVQDHLFIESQENSDVTATISDAEYSNVKVDIENTEPTIRFIITANLVKSKASQLLEELNLAGFAQQFNDELTKINDLVNDVIRLSVVRINHKTGARETFKQLQSNSANLTAGQFQFEDSYQTRKKFNISALDPFVKYTYEIRAKIINPITLLRDYVKTETVTVGTGQKTFSYKPYKWKQPSIKITGATPEKDGNGDPLVDEEEQSTYAGVVARYDTSSVFLGLTGIEDLLLERVDIRTVKISWTLQGSKSYYDHFVIVKELNGVRKILGVCHSDPFIDKITVADSGTLIYYITPVLNDYTIGETLKTNSILIQPSDFTSKKAVLAQ